MPFLLQYINKLSESSYKFHSTLSIHSHKKTCPFKQFPIQSLFLHTSFNP